MNCRQYTLLFVYMISILICLHEFHYGPVATCQVHSHKYEQIRKITNHYNFDAMVNTCEYLTKPKPGDEYALIKSGYSYFGECMHDTDLFIALKAGNIRHECHRQINMKFTLGNVVFIRQYNRTGLLAETDNVLPDDMIREKCNNETYKCSLTGTPAPKIMDFIFIGIVQIIALVGVCQAYYEWY